MLQAVTAVVTGHPRREAAMRRTIVVEFDDAGSATMQRRPERNLKRIFRAIGDQLAWGDTQRPVQDGDGNVIGQWRLVTPAENPAG